jgi:hypothetical protein
MLWYLVKLKDNFIYNDHLVSTQLTSPTSIEHKKLFLSSQLSCCKKMFKYRSEVWDEVPRNFTDNLSFKF